MGWRLAAWFTRCDGLRDAGRRDGEGGDPPSDRHGDARWLDDRLSYTVVGTSLGFIAVVLLLLQWAGYAHLEIRLARWERSHAWWRGTVALRLAVGLIVSTLPLITLIPV